MTKEEALKERQELLASEPLKFVKLTKEDIKKLKQLKKKNAADKQD